MKCSEPSTRRLRTALFGIGPAALLAALLGMSGCATKPKTEASKSYIFFPPAPDAPRLQFLVSYASEEELRGGAGGFSTFVTGEKPARNPILKPYGLALRHNLLYVCDTALNAVLILDLAKRRVTALAPSGQAGLKEPLNLAVDEDGSRYVVDTLRNQVLIFDDKGRLQTAVGQKDEMKPRDVVLTKDKFYVADVLNHCVKVFDKGTRKQVEVIPRDQDTNNILARLFQPTNLAIDAQGRLHVCDTGAFRVQQYDAAGKFTRSFGRNGDAPGEFKMPKGVAVDQAGRVYVVDAANQVIQIFDDQGRLLMWFGEPEASEAALDLPAKVIIDYEHVPLFQKFAQPGFELEYLVIVSNQFGPRKVSVYGFGHKK